MKGIRCRYNKLHIPAILTYLLTYIYNGRRDLLLYKSFLFFCFFWQAGRIGGYSIKSIKSIPSSISNQSINQSINQPTN